MSESPSAPDVPAILKRFHERIAQEGLKSTRQRDVIVETFFRLNKHISVEELLGAVRESAPHIGYATVYRTLKLLVEYGFAQPRHFGDGQTRFDPLETEDDEHDHLICVDCRRVIEFEDETIQARLRQITRELGDFELSRRRLEIYAKCQIKDCSFRAARSSRPA